MSRGKLSVHAFNDSPLSVSHKVLISRVLSRSTNVQLNACYYLQKINSFHTRRVCKRARGFVACVTRCLRLSHERGVSSRLRSNDSSKKSPRFASVGKRSASHSFITSITLSVIINRRPFRCTYCMRRVCNEN